MVRREGVGRDQGCQPGRDSRVQPVFGILERQARAGRQLQPLQGLQVDLRVRLLARRGRGVFDHHEVLPPVGPDRGAQQRADVDGRGGGGNRQAQAVGKCRFDQPEHAGAQGHGAVLHRFFVGGGLELVNAIDRVLHGLAVERPDVGVRLLPVVLDALLAARDAEQFGVERLVPVPVHAQFGERLVERGTVRVLGVGQRAIDIENQGLQGACGHGILSGHGGCGRRISVKVDLL
jgi:hypothetical protein